MASQTDHPAAGAVDSRLRAQVRGLRTALRLGLALRGLGWAAGAVLLAAWVSLAADYGLYRLTVHHLSLAPRLLVNAVCLAVAGVVAWRRLVRPVLRRFSDADLAALVERAHPHLEDRLLSTIYFARPSGRPKGASSELMDRVMREAAAAARALRFTSVLRVRPVWRALLGTGGLLLATAGLAWATPTIATQWARRNLLMQESSYPKRTHLEVLGKNPTRVLRGDPLKVAVTARAGRVAPPHVTFHMQFPSTGDAAESVPADARDPTLYVKTFPMVNEPFTFHVTGNDDRTGEVRVVVIERPELKELDLEVRSPVYTGLAPKKVRRGVGTVDVPVDGGIVLVGLATKDLQTAQITLDGEPAGTCRVLETGPEAGRRIEGQVVVQAPQPFRPSLALRVALRDTEECVNAKAASYTLLLRPDQPPTVHLEAVRMGGEITSVAVVPLEVAARDDYGVASAHLAWSVQSAPQETREEVVRAYLPPAPEPQAVPHPFDLRALAARNETSGPPLQVGETLRLQAAATDSRPASAGGAQRAASNLLTFRIVTAEELLAKAVDTQRALREQVDQTIEMQKDVRRRCEAAAVQAGQPTTLGLARRDVVAAGDTQQQIDDLLAGTVERLEGLLEQLRNNRAVAGEDEVRLRVSVIEPLRTVTRDVIGPLVRRLEAARSLAAGGALAAEMTALLSLQDRAIRALESVVAEMYKVENAQGVEGSLRSLIKLGDKVRETIRDRRAPEGEPAPGPATKPPEIEP